MSWIVVAACLGLVLPTANYAIFDGLPLSTVPEAGAATLLLAVIVSRSLRQGVFARFTGRVSVTRVLVGLASAVIVGKTVLLLSGTALGLPGCYTTPLGSPANGKCEVSYENPGFDYGATRVDRAISFGERDWNLSFVNSSRFNYYSWVRGNRRRDRLPLAVTWLGRLDSPRDVTLELTYVGEGRLGVGKAQVELAPSYDGKEVVRVSLPPGRQLISLVYRFDDHSAVGSRVRGPYGLLSVRFLDDHGRTADVTLSPGRPPRTSHRVVALLSDLALLVVVGALGISILLTAKIAIPLALLALAVAVGIARCGLGGQAVYLLHWGFAATLLATLIARPTPGLLAACLPLASVPVLGRLTLALPHPGSVLYRQAGNDWLTYESFARTILETGSL